MKAGAAIAIPLVAWFVVTATAQRTASTKPLLRRRSLQDSDSGSGGMNSTAPSSPGTIYARNGTTGIMPLVWDITGNDTFVPVRRNSTVTPSSNSSSSSSRGNSTSNRFGGNDNDLWLSDNDNWGDEPTNETDKKSVAAALNPDDNSSSPCDRKLYHRTGYVKPPNGGDNGMTNDEFDGDECGTESEDEDGDDEESADESSTHLDVRQWDMRRWMGLALLSFTFWFVLLLSSMAAYRRKKQEEQERWGAKLGTDHDVSEMLKVGWDGQKPVVTKKLGYRDDDSIFMGGFEQTETMQMSSTETVHLSSTTTNS
jgi:hypothetical protein